jgi:hypothetical protein
LRQEEERLVSHSGFSCHCEGAETMTDAELLEAA